MIKHVIKKLLEASGWRVSRIQKQVAPQKQTLPDIAFLHIGKNAGTQITHIAQYIRAETGIHILSLPHSKRLGNIDLDIPYFFSIRDPFSRFVSAFYSRKRKGQPRFYNEWTAHEALAFKHFAHANDLAEQLFSPGEKGAQAMAAIHSISHTSMQQIDWFTQCGYFLEQRPPLWIIRQEHFNEDIATFLTKAQIDLSVDSLPISSDSTVAHKNDYSEIPPLSDKAKQNLAKWYARDIAFYDACEAWMEKNK